MHEYLLHLGPVGRTASGLANLNTIAQSVAGAILRRGGSAYLQIRQMPGDTTRPTPYLFVSSANGSLDAGCSTMNALLEIADQAGVSANDIDPELLSMYARHPSAEIPPSLSAHARAAAADAPQRSRPHQPQNEYEGIDTDAEQEDIVRRVQQLQRRAPPGGAASRPAPQQTSGRRGDGDDDSGDEEAAERADQFVVAGLGRRQKRVVQRRRRRTEQMFGNDPNFGHMYGSSYMVGEPSDTEGDVLRRAGFGSEKPASDDGESAGQLFGTGADNDDTDGEMREVSVPREFDAEYDIGLTRNPKNPRNVVLSSIPQSQVVTRDKTRLESMIKDEAKLRKEQTKRIRDMYANEKRRSGNHDLPAPINERRLITKRVDPQSAHTQAEEERGAWDMQQARRIPQKYRDGSGQVLQDMVAAGGYQDRVKPKKMSASDLANLQRSEGKQRMRMNQQLWDVSSDDEDGEYGDRSAPQGLPRANDRIRADVHPRATDMNELRESGFGLTDTESDDGGDRVPVSAHDKRSRISNALYATFEDDEADATTDED